ncbi:hypothetical protein HK097_011219 [Rhizophlyctis rosea]|uniref:Right handed beta helix domain-containing protein n=1 Tax=Rhizophlyctis rosea TaxID=64517 RepID=A0AAD5S8D0_9FUNG|nr:hypothetical protein HK097_011219 [Rhizophlyctis rosea]
MAVVKTKLRNNPSDAIVADSDGNGGPVLFVDECEIEKNGGGVMFGVCGGDGTVSRSTITGNAVYGIAIHAVTSDVIESRLGPPFKLGQYSQHGTMAAFVNQVWARL